MLGVDSGTEFVTIVLYNSDMVYEVVVGNAVHRDIGKLQRYEQVRAFKAMASLAEDARPHGCVKMADTRNGYRIRFGNYRIVYTVDDENRIVTITRVAHRKEVYR